MPKYKFKGENGGLTALYKPNGVFEEFLYYDGLDRQMLIKNVSGSTVLIDLASSHRLNKIHIGDLVVRNPHVEANLKGEINPRVDLHEFDLTYAKQRLDELERWRDDPEYRGHLRDYHYRKGDIYFVRPRLRQLAVSDDELERRIEQHENLVRTLETRDDSGFAYPLTNAIEADVQTLNCAVKAEIEEYLRTAVITKRKEKIILPLVVVDIARGIYDKLGFVLRFVNERANYRKAERYWDEVERWGPEEGHIFIGCIPGAREHIARHIEGSGVIGSGLFKDFIPRFFPSMDKFLYYLARECKDAQFSLPSVAVEMEFPEPIGFESVIALEDLPPGVEVRREMREKYEVNVVSGIERRLTNNLIIVLAGWRMNEYGVCTAFPGEEFAPMLDDEEYWSRHAFIEPS